MIFRLAAVKTTTKMFKGYEHKKLKDIKRNNQRELHFIFIGMARTLLDPSHVCQNLAGELLVNSSTKIVFGVFQDTLMYRYNSIKGGFMPSKFVSMSLVVLALCFSSTLKAEQCPEYLNHQLLKLHSQKTLNICETYASKPLLIVNTASYCGYTPQFAGLEKLYKQYKDKGLVILGFASNDFDQEAKDSAEIAKVCYVNYGVTFEMFAPIKVTGDSAHPLFKALALQSKQPAWNFNKYLLNRKGKVVKHFDSQVTPDSPTMKRAIEEILGE